MSESPKALRHAKAMDIEGKADLLPTYESSWAVVIGINNYAHFHRLDNAVKDAPREQPIYAPVAN